MFMEKKAKMIYDNDPWLMPYKDAVDARHARIVEAIEDIAVDGSLSKGVNNHLYYGMHRKDDGSWVFREWAPNASKIYLIGDFNNWRRSEAYALHPVGNGNWEINLDPMFISHESLYKLYVEWPGGGGERLPAYTTRAVQDPETKVFSAQVWCPDSPYRWKHGKPGKREHPFIYECHIGMSSEQEKVSTFSEFRRDVLPKIVRDGYDTIQIMALQEHPYYGSFGYQVSNFYALSSRFGTPEEFKELVDEVPIPLTMNWRVSAISTARTTCIFIPETAAGIRHGVPAASITEGTRHSISFFPTASSGWRNTISTVSVLTESRA